jgi:AraC-like DNA-binding protein
LGEELSTTTDIVLMRHGAFCMHFGRRTHTIDTNQVVFFTRGSTYRVSHPADCGDRGTIFTVAPDVLIDRLREFDSRIDGRATGTIPFVTGPCDTDVFWRHRELVQRLKTGTATPLDPVWTDATALRLVDDVLKVAFRRTAVPRRCRRETTHANHADRAEAVKSLMAKRFCERVTLDEIARAVHVSPFHLARIFQKHAGMPLHRYLNRLRLRASLEKLVDGREDLTNLALTLGFSSHSHFTGAFRREFGRAPSSIRKDVRRGELREMSKNLEV